MFAAAASNNGVSYVSLPVNQPSDSGGGVIFLQFWTFLGFKNWSSVSSGYLGETSIFKIIMTDDVALWSTLEYTW